jgi:endonuclease/exonuclease/phosphatase family metal-dependent hydrolase
MKAWLTVFALIVVLSAASLEAAAQSIRVATFNVNWGNQHGDRMLEAIAAAKADILCLQETTPQAERFLKPRLADRYPEFHVVGHEGDYYAERFVFASRVKPLALKFHPPEAGLFGFYVATFRIEGREVCVVNVHLAPVVIEPESRMLDAMNALADFEERHAKEIEAILAAIDPEKPTIIAGDFNSVSTFKAPQRLLEKGFIDSFASMHDDADHHATWKWPTRPLPLALRIDYLFHTPHFETTASEILRDGGSDHYPLVSELKLVK